MKTIWKERLSWSDETDIKMPPNADILAVQMQDGNIMMWYEHDIDEQDVTRTFRVLPTGSEFADFKGRHIGTVQSGGYVWHAFEVYE